MSHHRLTGALTGTLIIAVAFVHAQDVAGRWTATFETQAGEQQYTYEFVVKGTTLTGTAKGNLTGESKISEGKVEGGKIAFVENAKFQDMDLRIEYTGTLASTGELRLTRKVGDFGSEELVAKRAK